MTDINRADDLDGFDDVISLLAEGRLDLTEADTPPNSLWASISAGVEAEAIAGDATEEQPPSISFEEMASSEAETANVVSLDDERTKRRWGLPAAIVTAAAAAALLVGVPLALSQQGDDAGDLVASGDLDWIGSGNGVPGAAEIISADGDLALNLDSAALEAGDEAGEGEFLEVWLLETDESGVVDLVSLGRWNEGGSYNVDDDVDLSRFDVVDVSLELDDGDDSHGGNSLLRGELDL